MWSLWACKEPCGGQACCFDPSTDMVSITVEDSLKLHEAAHFQLELLQAQKLPSLLGKSACPCEDLKLDLGGNDDMQVRERMEPEAEPVEVRSLRDIGGEQGKLQGTQAFSELQRAMQERTWEQEERRQRAERLRSEAAAQQAIQRAKESAEKARQKAAEEDAERLRLEAEEEAAFRARLERKREEKRRAKEDQDKVDDYLKKHKFSHVNEKQSKFLKKFYPLHVAAADGDFEMVQLLLNAGANRGDRKSVV